MDLSRVDFRLRLVAPGRLELHLLSSDASAMPASLMDTLAEEAHAAMPGYPRPIPAFQENLSGFFDRT